MARYRCRKDRARLMNDAGIVRQPRQIDAAQSVGAGIYLASCEKRSEDFPRCLWDFVGGTPQVNHRRGYCRGAGGNAALACDF